MKDILLACGILLTFTNTCYSINVFLNNEPTTKTSFCLGDRVTFICTIDDSAYQWLVDHPALKEGGKDYVTIRSETPTRLGPFNVSIVENQYAGRTSSLSVEIFRGFNSTLSCRGANTYQSQTLMMDITIPSKPSILADGGVDFQSIPNITIFPPKIGSECIRKYLVTVTEDYMQTDHDAGHYSSTLSKSYSTVVPVEGAAGQVVSKNMRELFPHSEPNLCQNRYSFVVTIGNSDINSTTVEADLHYEALPKIQDLQVHGMTTVQWVLPQALFICVDGYKYILKSSNFTKVMWETQTELPLLKITQHSRPNPCHADVVSIVPHVRHYKFMPSSQASQVILLEYPFQSAPHMTSTPHAITFRFEANLDGCEGAFINAAISRNHFLLQRISVPANATDVSLTGLVPNSTYLCDFSVSSADFAVLFAETFDCFTDAKLNTMTRTYPITHILFIIMLLNVT